MVRGRSGYTLLEVMVATVVAAVALTALATFVIGTHRLVRGAYVESQLSLALRERRERVLFQTLREGGNAAWGGLLSARDVKAAAAHVGYSAVGIDKASGRAMERGSQSWPGEIEPALAASHGLFTVALSETIGGETRRDRVVIPVFGKSQRTDASHLFFDAP